MMTALATITDVHSTPNGYQVALSCEQTTSCSSCSSQKSCGTGIVSKAVGNKALSWELTTKDLVHEGQVVEIGFPEKNLLQSAAIVYLVPLFMLMVGAAVGQLLIAPTLQLGEGGVILTSALFAYAGLWLSKRLSKPIAEQSQQEVILIRVLGEPIT
ncbi:SoxR reducing system RseC family protein [Vibrio cortegadensis]|uniref:SoxR reducing system RseC family protein n=1 Tax=Vibrio cortegadensis TaxID=1328770 RepID=UPI0021C3E6C2|nr:SoxR reducing system RseC family protein [Vibrio cortegadensis]MDN3699087.1 SoxR reducing system RseC family protein [Vibrio cortegadensis]